MAAVDWSRALPRHERWLRLVILARVRERQAVDEVMQELALCVVRAKNVPADPDRLPAWLYRVAVRQALLYRRKHGRHMRLMDRYSARSAQPELLAGDPLAWLLADERARLVREAISQLSPRDSEILLLRYASDWSSRQLADHLGVSMAAIEARLHRARQRMREILMSRSGIEVVA
jgi:RNA polymerase sigma-70 factor (ECF subfamily)